uniref:Uncharacterized protein n=1 Tax=viral metagenome TaxID=1070528 RepID=A0A6M3J3M4_9ZZZZ
MSSLVEQLAAVAVSYFRGAFKPEVAWCQTAYGADGDGVGIYLKWRWLPKVMRTVLLLSHRERKSARDIWILWQVKVFQAAELARRDPVYRNYRNSLALFRMNGQRWAA